MFAQTQAIASGLSQEPVGGFGGYRRGGDKGGVYKYFITKIFNHTETLKELDRHYPSIHRLNSTINISLDLLYPTSLHLPIHLTL